jgi:hypothetical protein
MELPDDFVEAALTAASELAANAAAHVLSPVTAGLPELWLHFAQCPGPRLVVSVFDTDRGHRPTLADPTELEESGRGLRIVAALSAEWGTRLTRSRLGPWHVAGKAVWAALALPKTRVPLTSPAPTPYIAAELLHAALTARGIDHLYRHRDDQLQVISVRSGLTVWVGETFSWRDGDGRYITQPLGDITHVTEQIVERYEQLGHRSQHALTR